MRPLAILLLTASLAAQAGLARGDDSGLRTSVVKVFTVTKDPNYFQPWDMSFQENSGGSGFIIRGNRIMTNAHVVANQVYVQVLKVGDTRRYTAKVEHVAHDCEIALLAVEDPKFFEGTVPARLGELPAQRDKVAAYGFPMGGNELSITEGVVSRIEVNDYTHSERRLLIIQTDAAINPGNSGGPVFRGDRLIGISFQSYSGAGVENTGYIVPVPLVRRFLKDIEDGTYDGVPSLGLYWQKMENDSLRAYYGVKGFRGVYVTKVIRGSAAGDAVREGDVLLSVAGTPIAHDGTIPFRRHERVEFSHAFSRFQLGERVPFEILRGGRELRLSVTLKPFRHLIPRPEYDKRPSYFIFGGLVFIPMTHNLMKVWEDEDVSPRFRHLYRNGLPSADRGQVVIINQVLPHGVNVGYHELSQAVVTRINGTPIARLQDVPAALRKPVNGFHVFELDNHADGADVGTRLVLDARAAENAGPEILKRFGIPSDRSADLLDESGTPK